MSERTVYSIFPAPPSSPRPQNKDRQSSDSRQRPSFDRPPHPPPSAPLPPLPTPHPSSHQNAPPSPHLGPSSTTTEARPARLPVRRRVSPNREFADFQRELAQPSTHRPNSPSRHRATSPHPPPSHASSSRKSNRGPPSRQSHRPADPPPSVRSRQTAEPPEDPMHSSSMLSNSSGSSVSSFAKPPVFPPSTSSVPNSNPPLHHAQPQSRQPRPNTVYFHGSIGGAGNYRKVKSEKKGAPRAYAENAAPLRRPASPTRFLSGLLGGQRSRSPANPNGVTGAPYDGRASPSEEDIAREEVDLGAAEMLKRKLVGGGWRKKGGQ